MPIETLTELQYSTDRKGPWQLYIYDQNSEYHRGGVYFMKKPRYPEEGEISVGDALGLVELAMDHKREIRIVDSGDMLVFHAKGGKVLYPNNPEKFWEEIAA
jgi:hypothetical protein